MAKPFTLAEITRRVSALPPLNKPELVAAYAFLEALGGSEHLQPEHIAAETEQGQLRDATATLLHHEEQVWDWYNSLEKLEPRPHPKPSAEYGI